ncbi:hypothetical protein XELAEV_18035270mg [Xenopus laevis]|uniref:Uncharacterized protein n=1 Tax=Xenopus laevis TaxID=8355 RepID=A0A974CFY3_XENLA|nr:hypothetical protein XELAEV_18035270mg [Xenopus laevis]
MYCEEFSIKTFSKNEVTIQHYPLQKAWQKCSAQVTFIELLKRQYTVPLTATEKQKTFYIFLLTRRCSLPLFQKGRYLSTLHDSGNLAMHEPKVCNVYLSLILHKNKTSTFVINFQSLRKSSQQPQPHLAHLRYMNAFIKSAWENISFETSKYYDTLLHESRCILFANLLLKCTYCEIQFTTPAKLFI